MNQARSFLILALVFVAYLLWNQWQQTYPPEGSQAPVAAASSTQPSRSAGASGSVASADVPTATVPSAATSTAPAATPDVAAHAGAGAVSTQTHGQQVTVTTDVLRLTIDTRGGSIVRAALLKYPKTLGAKQSVQLLDDSPARAFTAQSGLVSRNAPAPDHRALFHVGKLHYALASGHKTVTVPLTWTAPDGVKVTKRYVFTRGSYVIKLQQQIDNGSASVWQGNAYRQLQRVVPPKPTYSNILAKYSDQSRYGYFGAAWYSPDDKFSKLAFDKFHEDPLKQRVSGGWVGMIQNYFMSAWLPPAKEKDQFASAVIQTQGAKPHYLIRAVGPSIRVAPGASTVSHARLYVGPKLRSRLADVAPGMKLAVDYGMFTLVAVPLHAVLTFFYNISGNWGVAIILLVLLINIVFYKLNAAQYKSAARMRKLKPRMDALKERYGDDKQKLQQATMEMYKKEKINPVGGCLPLLVTIPVFIGLYEVLRESVELRQAPFILWIHDLSAADPYFVLPILYAGVMLASQLLMPMQAGTDATQQKIMRFIPVVSGVFFAFFPAGLTLYYLVNGACRLGQQWWVMRRIDQQDTTKRLSKASR